MATLTDLLGRQIFGWASTVKSRETLGTDWAGPRDKPGVVRRTTGPNSLCKCAFLLP